MREFTTYIYMKYIILLFIFTGIHTAYAQTQTNGWLATFNTIKTGKKTSVHSDVQWRSGDDIKFTQTLLLRAGLNYHYNKKTILTAGYAYIDNYRNINGIDGYVPEHRIWEQIIYNHTIHKVSMSHRLRLEQRFLSRTIIDNNELKNDGTLFSNRIRYFVRTIVPLHAEATFSKGMFAALQNEVFLNIGNKKNVNGRSFDQNRLYLAVGYRFSKKFDLEMGYMNQYINGSSNNVNNHIAQMASYIRL